MSQPIDTACRILLVLCVLAWPVARAAEAPVQGQASPCVNPGKLEKGLEYWKQQYEKLDQDTYGGKGYTGKTGDLGMWFGWNENRVLMSYLVLFETLGEAKRLDQSVEHIDAMLAKAVDLDHDGFRGWPSQDGKEERCSYNESQAVEPIARFARIVHERPELHAKYLEKAKVYTAYVEQHVVAKWEKGFGLVFREFKDGTGVFSSEEKGHTVSRPHNQYASKMKILLDLYAIQGSRQYLERAEKSARYFKRCLTLVDGQAYHWDYHTCAGEWDYEWPKLGTPGGSWMNGGPEDFSHANTEIGFVVRLNREGRVLDAADMARFAGSLLHLMWNGDEKDPRFNEYIEKGNKHYDTGLIWEWVGLASYDGRLLPLFEKVLGNVLQDREYYKQQVQGKPVAHKAENGGIMLGIARLIEAARVNAAAK